VIKPTEPSLAQLDALVQPLRQPHGPLHAEPQLPRRLLLQRRGDERRHRVAPLLARFTERTMYLRPPVAATMLRRGFLARFRYVLVVLLGQMGGQHRRLLAVQVDIDDQYSRFKGPDLPLAVHNQPQRNGLHAAGRNPRRTLSQSNGEIL
jgi:hypothetical protein